MPFFSKDLLPVRSDIRDTADCALCVASYYCTYAKMWVKVKSVYDLTITTDEKSALTSMLNTC